MKVSELLAAARDELFKGWTQGKLKDNVGNVCAVGALRRATMGHIQEGSVAVFNKARTALNVKATEMKADVGMVDGFGPNIAVESFNDFGGTTKDDMLALFDKTIIGLEEVGS
jgi:hypothetical protein